MCSPFYYSEKELAIAYSSGYECGHHDTVEGVFSGCGQSEEHDEGALDWLESAIKDGTFERDLNVS
jgi:hypothetical protein